MNSPVSITVTKPGDNSFHLFWDDGNSLNLSYLRHCIVAEQDGQQVGRLCIYDNPHLLHEGQPVLLFGNFECVNDASICAAMMACVEREARLLNRHFIIGPMNGSTWGDYRLPVNAPVSPFLTDLQQPVYYSQLLEYNGYKRGYKYYSNSSDITADIVTDKNQHIQLEQQGVRIRTIDLDRFEDELKPIYALSQAAFAPNLFYSPISESDFIKKYLPLHRFLDSRFILLAEKGDNLQAFAFAFPDIYLEANNRLIFKTLAKQPYCMIKGLIDHMIKYLHEQAYNAGYTKLVHAFMQEQNKSLIISGRYEGAVLREYALYVKNIKID